MQVRVEVHMSGEVILRDGSRFAVDEGESITSAAQRAGLALPYSCLNGRCGVCKTIVLSGECRELQPSLVPDSDRLKANEILSCCNSVVEAVEIDSEDLSHLGLPALTMMAGKIDEIKVFSQDLMCVVIRLPPKKKMRYLPGQYVNVIGPDAVKRSYSFAGAPRADGKIELIIKRVKDGMLSKFWFEEAEPGDLLRLEGPLGTSVFRSKAIRELVFVATGSGIAPVKAMLEGLEEEVKINKRAGDFRITLIWGNRFKDDLFELPKFSFNDFSSVITLSRDDAHEGFRYVQDALEAMFTDLSNAEVYACGSQDMIRDISELTSRLALPRGRFHSDAFVATN